MISKEKIIKLAQERIQELDNGNYLVEVNISPKNAITVKMDNLNGGVSIKDCVSVSRNIEHNLDREIQDFELQVTSPGLDQPFKVAQQYQKNIGKKISLLTVDNQSVTGELLDFSDNIVKLKEINVVKNKLTKKKEIVEEIHLFKIGQIKETKLIISF
jgi:ribosome maturation factor RimP